MRRFETIVFWLLAPLLVVLAYRRVSGFDFVADADFLIRTNDYLRGPGSFWGQLTHDYFWSSSGNVIPYWRPVTKAEWWLDYRLFEGWAGGYLWLQVTLHAAAAIGVQLVAEELGSSRFYAVLAGVFVALHPVAVEPVALIMARSDVGAVAGGIWAFYAWLRWRRTSGWQGHAWLLMHVFALVYALGSKEAALGWPALLVVFSVIEGDFKNFRWLGTLAPALVLSLGYLVARRLVLVEVSTELAAVNLEFQPRRLAYCLAVYMRNLLPIVASNVRNVSLPEAGSDSALIRTVFTFAGAALVSGYLLRRRDWCSLGLFAGVVLLLLPVILPREIAVPEAAKYPLADRWLYHALPCASLLLARLAEQLLSALPGLRARVALGLLAAGWSGFLLFDSARASSELGSELSMLDNEDRLFYDAVPVEFRSHEDGCRFHERRLVRGLMRGRPVETLGAAPRAFEVCGTRAELVQHVLEATVRVGDYQRAAPLARALIGAPPLDGRGEGRRSYFIGLALRNSGDEEEGARWLRRAAERGFGAARGGP